MADVLVAPAKLTRSLRAVGVRPDGFHLIDAEMVTLDLADTLTFSEGDGLELRGAAADVTADDDHLVARALRLAGGPTADGRNDLAPGALAVAPGLAARRDRLGDLTGQTPVLAGSGSTWFVEGAHEADGLVVVHTVPAG